MRIDTWISAEDRMVRSEFDLGLASTFAPDSRASKRTDLSAFGTGIPYPTSAQAKPSLSLKSTWLQPGGLMDTLATREFCIAQENSE